MYALPPAQPPADPQRKPGQDKDPYELANIYNATVRANPTLTSELHGLLRQFYECRGAECP